MFWRSYNTVEEESNVYTSSGEVENKRACYRSEHTFAVIYRN